MKYIKCLNDVFMSRPICSNTVISCIFRISYFRRYIYIHVCVFPVFFWWIVFRVLCFRTKVCWCSGGENLGSRSSINIFKIKITHSSILNSVCLRIRASLFTDCCIFSLYCRFKVTPSARCVPADNVSCSDIFNKGCILFFWLTYYFMFYFSFVQNLYTLFCTFIRFPCCV
jgi:hypothetical protein